MKTVAKISVVLACLAVLVVAGYALSSRLDLNGRVHALPASADAEAFAALQKSVERGEYEGAYALSDADGYYFVTVSVDVKSYSPFKTEWINLKIESEDGAQILDRDTRRKGDVTGDTLLVSEKNAWLREMESFGKLESGDSLTLTLLSPSEHPHLKAYVEYYIFGRYHISEVDLKTVK